MGLFNNLFKKNQDKVFDNRLMQALFQFINNGVVYNSADFSANVKTYQDNAALYSVINLITRNLSTVEWKLYEIKNEKAFKGFKSTFHNPISLKNIEFETKALNEVESHPILTQFFDRPNKLQGYSEFIEEFFGFKLLTGNGYINGIRQPIGVNKDLFQEFFIMPSHLVEIITGGWREPVSSYKLDFSWDKAYEIESADVLHSKFWNPNYENGEHLYGLSPSKAANKSLTSIDEGNNANVKSFQNMGAAGILSSKGFKTDKDFGDKLVAAYYEKFGGTDNTGKVMFSPFDLTYHDMAKSPVDMNILASNKDALRTVCNAWGLQSQLLNDPDNKTFNNQKEAKKALYTDIIIPMLNNFGKEINRWLISNYNEKVNTKLYAAPDWRNHPVLQEEFDLLTTSLVKAWWLSPNEKRRMQGRDEINDPMMDKIFIPKNFIEIANINNSNSAH